MTKLKRQIKMSRRKISSGPAFQPILEDGQVVEVFEDDVFKSQPKVDPITIRVPPQIPGSKSCIDDRISYVDQAIGWLKDELTDLKRQDKDLMNAYKHLMSTVTTLKKMNVTFQEQCTIMNNMTEKTESPAIVDLPKQKLNELRYKRITQMERHCSYS